MRNAMVAIGFILLLMLSGMAWGVEYKLAFVDLQKALNRCKAGQDAKEEFTKKVGKVEEKLSVQQEELKRLKDALDKQTSMLSEEARKQKEWDYQTKLRDFKRLYQDAQDELKVQDGEFTQGIVEGLVSVAHDYGKEKGFTFVFEKSESALLFADEALDITEEIIKLYDQQYLQKQTPVKK